MGCISKLLEHMDKWQVIDDILSWLSQIPSKEPAVIMAIVGIFKLAFTNSKLGLTKEVMANKVLPFLIPLSIENGLTVQQFNSITSIIKEMFIKVETEHRTKLEQLNAIQDSQKSTLKVGLSDNVALPPGQLVAAPTSQEVSSMDSMFDGLGLGTYVNQDKNRLLNKVIGGNDGHNSNNNNLQSISKSSSSHTLSLQEKQRILADQELARSRVADKTQSSSSPVNLTDSLPKSLSMNQMPSVSNTWKASNVSSNTWNTPNSSSGSNWMNTNNKFGGQISPTPSGISSNTMMQPISLPVSTSQKATTPDLSAFDSLFGGPAKSKTPMNSMQGMNSMQLMTPNATAQFNKPVGQNHSNPLSANEINDFLS